jgi:hypothetical protein
MSYSSLGEVGQGSTLEFENPTAAPGVWTKVKEVTSVTPPKPENSLWDATHLESGADKEERPGMGSASKWTLKCTWIDDATQAALVTARAARTDLNWKCTLPTAIGTIITWSGALTSFGVDDVAPDGGLVASGGGSARNVAYA